MGRAEDLRVGGQRRRIKPLRQFARDERLGQGRIGGIVLHPDGEVAALRIDAHPPPTLVGVDVGQIGEGVHLAHALGREGEGPGGDDEENKENVKH